MKLHPGARIASSDTICRVLKSLACESPKYTSERGITYGHNAAERMNYLLLDMLMATG